MKQSYLIAGLKVEMDATGRIEAQARPYLCDAFLEPDIVIQPNLQSVRDKMPNMSEDEYLYVATCTSFHRQLLKFDAFLLHSSAVLMDGKAYLFFAPSGTGKSTHTQLWRKVFGDRAQILNDDRPALRLENGVWYAYGIPWSGKTNLNINTKAPVAGICMLTRGEVNRIAPLSGMKALHGILGQASRSRVPELMSRMLELIENLMDNVPVWKLECNMDPQAALVSYEAMSGKKEEC